MLMGHGWAPLVDGWQVSGTVFYRTGFPFTVIDTAASGTLSSFNLGGPIFPDPISGATLGTSCNSKSAAGGPGGTAATPCLTNSEFVAPGTETDFGFKGLRNAFRGPHYFD